MQLLVGHILYAFEAGKTDVRVTVEDTKQAYVSISYLSHQMADELKFRLIGHGARKIG